MDFYKLYYVETIAEEKLDFVNSQESVNRV